MARFIPLATYRAAAGGNLPAAYLLQLLVRLYEAGNFVDDGMRWHARTREEICKELQFSVSKYQRALTCLISAGVVTVKTGPHPYKPRLLRVSYFHITERGYALLQPKQSGQNEPNGRVRMNRMIGSKRTDPLYITTKITTKRQLKPEPSAGADAMQDDLQAKKMKKTVAEFQAEDRAKLPLKPSRWKSGHDVEMLWRHCLVKHDIAPPHMLTQWTGKQRGAAGKIIASLGDDPELLLDTILPNWSEFVDFCRERRKIHMAEQPDILSLAGVHDLAGNFFSGRRNKTEARRVRRRMSDL